MRQLVVTEGLHSQLLFCAPGGHEDGEELEQMRRDRHVCTIVLCCSIVVRIRVRRAFHNPCCCIHNPIVVIG